MFSILNTIKECINTLIASVCEKISTFVTSVTLYNKESITLKELMISRYNDFILFINKSIYRKLNDKHAINDAIKQQEFLKVLISVIKTVQFNKKIENDLAKTNIDQMISLRHYFALTNGIQSDFSYHVDSCSFNQVGNDKSSKKGV